MCDFIGCNSISHYNPSATYLVLHSFPTRRSSDLSEERAAALGAQPLATFRGSASVGVDPTVMGIGPIPADADRKSTRLNSSHVETSYAVFCLKKNNVYSFT